MKKRTHEEYLKLIKEKGLHVKVLEQYQGNSVPILHYCTIDNINWKVRPSDVLNGRGCPECKRRKSKIAQSKTHNQYLKELQVKNIQVIPLERYQGAEKNIKHKCLKCGYEWSARPANILFGFGCPLCSRQMANEKKTYTHEQFIEKIKDLLSPNIEIIGRYTGNKKPIECKCLLCGKQFIVKAEKLYSISACPDCGRKIGSENRRKASGQRFYNALNKMNITIRPLSPYVRAKEKMHFIDDSCGHDWWAVPGNILKGHGCPVCASSATGDRCRKTNDKFLEDINQKNIYIEPLEPYIDSQTPILCKCKTCGNAWKIKPGNLLQNKGCPYCNITSQPERLIYNYLQKRGILFEHHKIFDGLLGLGGKHLSYDFFVPDYNLLIEYQGEQHYKMIDAWGGEEKYKERIEHDRRKKEYAKQHGYNLLEINNYEKGINNILDEELNKLKPISVETVTGT